MNRVLTIASIIVVAFVVGTIGGHTLTAFAPRTVLEP